MPVTEALFSSERQDWCTPMDIIKRVHRYSFDGRIGLDPCSSPRSIVGAIRSIQLPEDGLSADWGALCEYAGKRLVYMNPPYGRRIGDWTSKAVAEYKKSQLLDVIGLVPARTDTKWFQRDCLDEARAMCFWKGRLTFLGAPASAPFPSAIVYWGYNPYGFADAFRSAGVTWS